MNAIVLPTDKKPPPVPGAGATARPREAAPIELLARAFHFLASYGLSCFLFFFLFVLTLLGTLEQVDSGLYATQQKYFESLIVIHAFGPVPLPLPGGGLLLAALFVNLLCGAVIRARKGWKRIGLLLAHAGILLLLAGAFLAHRYSVNGELILAEGEEAAYFESGREWEVVLTEWEPGAGGREHRIPAERLAGTSAVFAPEGWPFEVEIAGYASHTVPQAVAPGSPAGVRAVDGFTLVETGNTPQARMAAPGAFVALREKGSNRVHEGIAWGRARAPWRVEIGGRAWDIDLRRVRHELPFTLALERFHRELYPRTDVPKAFVSDVVAVEDGLRRSARITMNEPLRYKGYTVYQASWSPEGPEGRSSSTFAVVRNPVERFPLYACLVVALGLTFHFIVRLMSHLRTEGPHAA